MVAAEFVASVLHLMDGLKLGYSAVLVQVAATSDSLPLEESTLVRAAAGSSAEAGGPSRVRTDVVPESAEDQDFFLKLVSLVRLVLPSLSADALRSWLPLWMERCVSSAQQLPLVSGFLRLLTALLRAALRGNEPLDASTSQVIARFAEHLSEGMKHYSHELLASAALVLLHVPTSCCPPRKLFIAVDAALCLGLRYPVLAEEALYALERWKLSAMGELRELVETLYPLLEMHLRRSPAAASGAGAEETSADAAGDGSALSAASASSSRPHGRTFGVRRARKVVARLREQSEERGSARLRHRILRFYGSLGGSLSEAVVACGSTPDSMHVRSFGPPRLAIFLPFGDQLVRLYVELLLPHIVELATGSADRRTKVASCEVLHSMVLYVIGLSLESPRNVPAQESAWRGHVPRPAELRGSILSFFRRSLPVLVALADDVEGIARQLFSSLLPQMIRYFCIPEVTKSLPVWELLLDALWESVVRDGVGSARKSAALLITEFLREALATELQQSDYVEIAGRVVRRLSAYSLYESSLHRLGCLETYSCILDLFVEDSRDVLESRFVLEIARGVVCCASAPRADDSRDAGIAALASLQLKRLARFLVESEERFRRISGDGASFRHFHPSGVLSLLDFVLMRATVSARNALDPVLEFYHALRMATENSGLRPTPGLRQPPKSLTLLSSAGAGSDSCVASSPAQLFTVLRDGGNAAGVLRYLLRGASASDVLASSDSAVTACFGRVFECVLDPDRLKLPHSKLPFHLAVAEENELATLRADFFVGWCGLFLDVVGQARQQRVSEDVRGVECVSQLLGQRLDAVPSNFMRVLVYAVFSPSKIFGSAERSRGDGVDMAVQVVRALSASPQLGSFSEVVKRHYKKLGEVVDRTASRASDSSAAALARVERLREALVGCQRLASSETYLSKAQMQPTFDEVVRLLLAIDLRALPPAKSREAELLLAEVLSMRSDATALAAELVREPAR
ncbi:MAG TPA: hypothetical protein VJB16_07270, partial [archaeon]|nr:hypothetical protein [archaeon]